MNPLQWFTTRLEEKNILLSERQLQQLERYFELLVEWNEKMNLTGITEKEAVYEKHFFDSISLAFFVPLERYDSLIDVGCGAGFPSLPLKICFPHLKVTLLDSLNKRIKFLQCVATELELENVQFVHGRAEDVARSPLHREQYDLATARAVAKLNVLNELCIPFVKTGGHFVAMKGSDPADEIKEASKSLRLLYSECKNVYDLKLPLEQSDRHIIVVQKHKQTNSTYPRKAGTPNKQPL